MAPLSAEEPGRVVVVGGGIAGLAASFFLDTGPIPPSLTVLEAGAEGGGKVRSLRRDGRILDLGPNGWLSGEPAMDELIDGLGLREEVLQPSSAARKRFIFAGGKLHPVPLSILALASSSLLPWWAKVRLLGELFASRGPQGETVGDFTRRRLGTWALERLVAPMVAGIHAADPDTLELQSAFPRLFALEQEHRSLLIGSARGRGPRPHLQTLAGGAGTLTDALIAHMGPRLRTGTPATAVERRRTGWRVHTEEGSLDTDAVVLACPAWAQARLVRSLDPETSDALDAIPYAPVAVVLVAAEAGTWGREPEGFGVLGARSEPMEGALGVLFASQVFPDQAPEGQHLLRVFLGGSVHPGIVDEDPQALAGRALGALERILGRERKQPEVLEVVRHPRGIPQYTVGHRQRVARVHRCEAHHPGLFFAGNHLEGVAVKDTVRQARELSQRWQDWVESGTLSPR